MLLVIGCTPPKRPAPPALSLIDARRGFSTVLQPSKVVPEPVELAPASIFRTIKYPAPQGNLAAYLSPNPRDGKKHPAIIWITGGDCNSIGNVWSPMPRNNDQTATAFRQAGIVIVWSPMPRNNDQTATAFRQAGIVMMFPSLRGGNSNPGVKEGFLGEVDDVLAAANFLAQQDYVDPKRIFLGGHSTGGTLVLLVAEYTDRFRAVFAFGPVDDVSGYGPDSEFLPFDTANPQEIKLRSPGYWLAAIHSPVWIFEGTERGNIDSLRAMARASTNANVHFVEVKGASHFTILAPTNEIIAQKIRQDTGEPNHLDFSTKEINSIFAR